jgi:hypothetical protein
MDGGSLEEYIEMKSKLKSGHPYRARMDEVHNWCVCTGRALGTHTHTHTHTHRAHAWRRSTTGVCEHGGRVRHTQEHTHSASLSPEVRKIFSFFAMCSHGGGLIRTKYMCIIRMYTYMHALMEEVDTWCLRTGRALGTNPGKSVQ